ncbi:MAG: hypothetical protein GEV06_23620 [Luteitalea sp.]|nr:hypothetical protein [Luteitalea sp.]
MRRQRPVFFSALTATMVGRLALAAAQAPHSAAQERDPFTPPVAEDSVGPVSRRVRPVETRLSDLTLDGVVLIGVACSTARQAAVIRSSSGRSWAIAAGDRLRDSRVARVTCDAALFERASPRRRRGGLVSPKRRSREGGGATREVWRRLEGGHASSTRGGLVSPKRQSREDGEEAR